MPRERSAAAKVLLLLLRPVMWILGSDLWAFNVLCLGYAYCVWTGVFGSNLAWLVGKLLGTIAFVAAVSTKLFDAYARPFPPAVATRERHPTRFRVLRSVREAARRRRRQ